MAVVADDVGTDRKTVERELRFWAREYWRVCDNDGHQIRSAIDRLYEGLTHLNGHNVLIYDMKPEAWPTHWQVVQLPAIYAKALMAYYCLPARDEDGRFYRQRDIARALDCTVGTYRQRVKRAKSKIKVD